MKFRKTSYMEQKEEYKPFITEEAYKRYSLVHFEYMQKILNKVRYTPKVPDIPSNNEPAALKPTVTDKKVSKVTPKRKNENFGKQNGPNSQSGRRFSTLSGAEHSMYMKLVEKYKNPSYKSTGSVDELNEVKLFQELESKVILERAEYLLFLKNLAMTKRKFDYFCISADAKKFTRNLMKAELNRFCQELPTYYTTNQIVSFLPPGIDIKEDASLSFIKNILKLGNIPNFVVPRSPHITIKPYLNQLQQTFVKPITESQDVHPSKQNLLKDTIAADLSLKYQADIVATHRSLTTLFDNIYSSYEHSWEIPIKVVTDSFGANGKINKRLFLENPIPSSDMSVREKNTLYFNHAIKLKFVNIDSKKLRYQPAVNSRILQPVEDTFGDPNGIHDLESFGVPMTTNGNKMLTSKEQVPENLTKSDHVEIPASENLTTLETKSISDGDQTPECYTSVENGDTSIENQNSMDLSSSDDEVLSDAQVSAFLKLKKTIIKCDKKFNTSKRQKKYSSDSSDEDSESPLPSRVEHAFRRSSQDSDSDLLVIDSRKTNQSHGFPKEEFGLDEHDISVIEEVISKKEAKIQEKSLKKISCNSDTEKEQDTTLRNENSLSNWEENIAFNSRTSTPSTKSPEERRKLYQKKGNGITAIITSKSQNMDQPFAVENTKIETQCGRRNSQSTENKTWDSKAKKRKYSASDEDNGSPVSQKKALFSDSTAVNIPDVKQSSTKVNAANKEVQSHSSNTTEHNSEHKSVRSPLDQILNLQQKMFKPQNSSADNNRSTSLFLNNISKEEVMEEASKEYPQLIKGNVSYTLWRLGKLKLMLRSDVHSQLSGSSTPYFMFAKMEYQLNDGLEISTPSELMQQWVALQTCPGSQCARIRINPENSDLKMIEELSLPKLMKEENKFHSSRAIQQVSLILNKLTETLGDGYYLLVHRKKESTISVMKSAEDSKCGALNFHKALSDRVATLEDNEGLLRKDVPWLPIDPELYLPQHRKLGRIPGCFFVQRNDMNWKNQQHGGKKKKNKSKLKSKMAKSGKA